MSIVLVVFVKDAETGEFQVRQDGTILLTSRCPWLVLSLAAETARRINETIELTDEAADAIVQLANDSWD